MKDPPLTPYAIAGIIQRRRSRPRAGDRRLRLRARSAFAPASLAVYPTSRQRRHLPQKRTRTRSKHALITTARRLLDASGSSLVDRRSGRLGRLRHRRRGRRPGHRGETRTSDDAAVDGGGRREGEGNHRLVELAAREPRPLHDEHRRLRRQCHHPRRGGGLVSALLARRQPILFTRSKKGWVFERDANTDGKWDIYTVDARRKERDQDRRQRELGNLGLGPTRSCSRATTAIVRRKLGDGRRRWSSTARRCPSSTARSCSSRRCRRTAAISPSPCAARSARRASGTCSKKTWTRTGRGLPDQLEPDGAAIYWVHPTGNGGSRVLHMPIKDGKPPRATTTSTRSR